MWGENDYGIVGDGTLNDRSVPKKVLDSVASVLVSDESSAAIKEDGTVWVWGNAEGLGLPENFKGYKTVYNSSGDKVQYVDTPTQLLVPTAKPQCTITLNLNGGDGTTKLTCDKNGTITPPNNPSRDGYFFAGWYKDKACKKPWNFDTDKVTGNCTLYAKWEPKSTTTVTAEPSTQKVEIDGKKIVLNSYVLRNDQGYPVNFVKLRDIAYLLNGTHRDVELIPGKTTTLVIENFKQPGMIIEKIDADIRAKFRVVLMDGVDDALDAVLLRDGAERRAG